MADEHLLPGDAHAVPFDPGVQAQAPPTPPVAPAATHGGPPPAVTAPAADEIHLLDYVRILYKRRWIATTVFVLVVGAVTAYTFSATPIYEARVQILIEKESTNVVAFKEAFEQNQATDDYYQTQYKILQSRALARRTLDSLDLWNHPLLGARPGGEGSASEKPSPLTIGWEWASQLIRRAADPAEPPPPTGDETAAQSLVIDAFLGNLIVAPIKSSRLVDVRYASPEPAFAADVVNALAKNYIEQDLEFKFVASKEASDWLGQRLAEQRQHVEASEQALQQYREQTDAVALEDKQNIVVQKLGDLNAAVTRAKMERIQKEAVYNQMRTIQGDRAALDTFPSILSNTFIQQQKAELADLQRQQAQAAEKLGDRHPDMIKLRSAIQMAESRIQGEIAKIVQSTRNEYLAAMAQEKDLVAALDQQKVEMLALNRKGIDYRVLERDVATNQQIFESLLQRTKETGISGELKATNIRIVDAAEIPRRPARPNRPFNELLGVVGGGMLAIGLAFFIEYLDNRIKSPEELGAHLGLPFLGMVPTVFDKALSVPLINNGVPANFAEAFRTVRTNVLFSTANEGRACSLTVTSSVPGEGKTLVSSNLALALAETGQRILLIDADMRRSRIHDIFGCKAEPGLSNVLVGSSKLAQAMVQTAVPRLFVLAAGHAPPNPAALLGTKRFKEFLAAMHQHFDWILIDTPPISVVTDAAVVAHQTAGVLFVVGSEMISRQAIRRALAQLERAQGNLLGAVLNKADVQHNPYYYSHYYRREYSGYYTPSSAGAPAQG